MRIEATPPVSPSAPSSSASSLVSSQADTQASSSPSQAPLGLNPNLHIDQELGIVVMRYLDAQGDVTVQFPAARIIEKYRVYGMQDGAPSARS
ncbi:hypothetical protein [Lichenicoccus sp.]|uniref:hypothetical protein n=1 Tax=Lichenicoccus sp. TaxID=2781899 RepID=UPI003D0B61AB